MDLHMTLSTYLISAVLVFVFSGLLAMAGLGAAFLFVPFFYYLGVPLAEATPTALLLNVVSLLFATINYWRGKLINFRVGLPVLIVAVILSPLGARLTPYVDKRLLLGLFAAFLIFAGFMMLFYRAKKRAQALSRPVEVAAGAGVGGVAGFLGGLLGVGGGNFILPVLNWLGLDPKIAAGTTALVPGPRHPGRPGSALHRRHRGDGRRRLHRRLAVDEDQAVEQPAQEGDRRVAVADRRQDDLRFDQVTRYPYRLHKMNLALQGRLIQ
jgi:uncharacterized membrane protein YfcA